VRIRRILLRLLGQALLVVGFALAIRAVIGLGNDTGPLEPILTIVGAAGLVVLGWLVWDRSVSGRPRTGRSTAS
jgi:hypothetical protein